MSTYEIVFAMDCCMIVVHLMEVYCIFMCSEHTCWLKAEEIWFMRWILHNTTTSCRATLMHRILDLLPSPTILGQDKSPVVHAYVGHACWQHRRDLVVHGPHTIRLALPAQLNT